jgi:heat-inducible transcriptional repressor
MLAFWQSPASTARAETLTEPQDQLSDRAQHLLKVLVERYIAEGQPVGSRTLAKGTDLAVSPATIRNTMADLEDMGFVCSPHTSAGRIPTAKGYRFFVDSLLKVQPPAAREVKRMQQELKDDGDPRQLMAAASKMISGVTQLAGLVTEPKRKVVCLRQIEFLPLTGHRVLAILVMNEREVQNRILEMDRAYTESELIEAANYVNAHFAGKDLEQVRRALAEELSRTQESVNARMIAAVQMAQTALEGDKARDEQDYVLAGENRLMSFAELSDMEKLQRLFEAFSQKRDLLHLLDRCIGAEGVQIFIGEESGYSVLDECSVVTAPYEVDGEVLGVLGVIGPTRIAYERIIPIVDISAQLLGKALAGR